MVWTLKVGRLWGWKVNRNGDLEAMSPREIEQAMEKERDAYGV